MGHFSSTVYCARLLILRAFHTYTNTPLPFIYEYTWLAHTKTHPLCIFIIPLVWLSVLHTHQSVLGRTAAVWVQLESVLRRREPSQGMLGTVLQDLKEEKKRLMDEEENKKGKGKEEEEEEEEEEEGAECVFWGKRERKVKDDMEGSRKKDGRK